ncbi:MAG: hypothetical protein KAI24_10930 [Planctomycetes bacterium]|nr:hypothetical protein [Planctomycetota bacterium]
MSTIRPRVQIAALIRTWLLLDFFGDARRAGSGNGSSLTTTIMWQSLLAFGFAMLLYPDVPAVPFVAANLCLSTLLVGIGSLGDEDRPLRLAADETLLAGAPVSATSIVLARSGHAAFQLVLVTTGMAISPAILLGHLTGDWLQSLGYVVAACACTGLTNAGLATMRALLARGVGATRATLAMGTIKAAMLGGGFVLFALALRELDGTADDLPIGRVGAELLPTYHAARLLADGAGESWRLLPWLGLTALLLLTNVLLRAGGAPTRLRIGGRQPLLRLLTRLSGRGPRLGVAEFVALSMWRSAGFRARVLPLMGLPAGMVFLTLGGDGGDDFVLLCLLLMLPAIYLPFLIAFLPRADQAKTGWVFAHAPALSRDLVSDATWRALTTHVLVPTYGLALALVVAFGPDRIDRAAAAVFAFAMAVLAAERMARLDRVPFTDDREEDRGLDLGGLMAGALLLGLLGTAFGAGLPPVLRWPIALLATGGAALRLRRLPTPDPSLTLADEEHGDAGRPAEAPQQPSTGEADPDETPVASVEPTLARELRAVAVLYVVLCVLPWLAGAAFAA